MQADAGPVIDTVQNNYGLIQPGVPNYAIAPSTLFLIKGSNLANVTTPLQSSAAPGLPTSLMDITVTAKVGNVSLSCPLYYISPTQIDAVLPGNTPLGTAAITVTNNRVSSAAFEIPVVPSAFGILSYNLTLAAAYDANNLLITNTSAANPGQTIVLWGSGVGTDAASTDRLYPERQNNLTGIPMQAFVGGVEAAIAYRGRSQYPGLDQVVLTIPANVPTGCYVSLAIVSGTMVSNSVTIPIAATGRTCSDASSPLLAIGSGTGTRGYLTAFRSMYIETGSGTSITSDIAAGFTRLTNYSGFVPVASMGSCLVYSDAQQSLPRTGQAVALDAGASINVSGPGGSVTLARRPGMPGNAPYTNDAIPAEFIEVGGGTFTFDNGSGGADLGHFSASGTVPANFVWTNEPEIDSVKRPEGFTVTWSGGVPATRVEISGDSAPMHFVCEAPAAAGQFRIPPSVLLSLPLGEGFLNVQALIDTPVKAPGVDIGYLETGIIITKAYVTWN